MDRYPALISEEEGQIVTSLSSPVFKEAFRDKWPCVRVSVRAGGVLTAPAEMFARTQRAVSRCEFAVHTQAERLFGLPRTESAPTNRPVRRGAEFTSAGYPHVMFYADR